MKKFKNLLLQGQFQANWAQSTLGWRAFKFVQIRNHSVLKKRQWLVIFFLSMLWYNCMCLLIWSVFSRERCGPWASCVGLGPPHHHSIPLVVYHYIKIDNWNTFQIFMWTLQVLKALWKIMWRTAYHLRKTTVKLVSSSSRLRKFYQL